MKNFWKELTKGIIKENPILVIALGLCPTLAVTTSAINGLGMGIAFTFVILGSNTIVSLIKNWVPKRIRIPIYITVIATFVTIVKLFMAAYTPALSKSLGIFVPLIVVNCIILGRAEAFASKHNILESIADAIGMGIGFTLVLIILGSVRELLGQGSLFSLRLMGAKYNPALLMILPPGGFLALGTMLGIIQYFKGRK